MSWFVLNVKRNQEKKVSEVLRKMNIDVFNPVLKEVKYWSGQERTLERSLFQSYIFINIPERYRGIVFGVSGVKSYLFLNGKPALVRDEEINIIKEWTAQKSNDLSVLSQLMAKKSIGSANHWMLNNNSEVLKWVGKSNIPVLLEDMENTVQSKLRKVI